MPVNHEHTQYKEYKDRWQKCRDVIEGSDKIKERGSVYLPRLNNQTEMEYSAYKDRALFYSATSRTVQALMGAIFRKDYTLEFPDLYSFLLEAITLDGLTFDEFVRMTVRDIISVGRIGILPDVITANDVDSRPYLATYQTESIINWKEVLVGNQKITSLIVLCEDYEIRKDQFQSEFKKQYRVLSLGLDDNKSPTYYQSVYRKLDDKEEYSMVGDLTAIPKRFGLPLSYIPFEFINTYDLTPDVSKPPLVDLVDVNISHYKTSADLEHGAHYTALPTAWVAGFKTDRDLSIGSATAWVTEETDAKAGFLEYTGAGLTALESRMQSKEQLMAILGARLLEDQKKAAEAADTLRIRAASESGSLTAIAKNISNGIENALKTLVWWAGASDQQVDEVVFELNTDFIDNKMQPQEMTALMQLHQAGAISQDTFLYNLKRGEILPDDRTIEDEKEMIEATNIDDTDLTNIIPLKRKFNVGTDDQGRPVSFEEV